MKTLLSLGAFFLFLRPAAAAETWALLIGVSKYQNPQIASLRYPAGDATGIQAALTDPQLGGLAADHVKLLVDKDATGAAILDAVDSFLKPRVKAGDKVVVFLAGHGIAKGVGAEARSFLLPHDTKGLTTQALEASAVNLQTLSTKLGELPAAQFALFVDACREDPTPGRGIKGNTMTDILSRGLQIVPADGRQANSATFFACAVGQRAYEDPTLKHGVFTYWILDGIKNADVPSRPDGAVDLGRLSTYVSQKVREWARKTSAAGDFEVEQSPELVSAGVTEPVILMQVKRPLPEKTLEAAPPRLMVAVYPETAEISVAGKKAGTGTIVESLDKPGEYQVRVSAPGYQPVERSVKVLEGYQQQLVVNLQPGGEGADSKALESLRKALALEEKGQYEAAEAGYQAATRQDPKLAEAWLRLAAIRGFGNRNSEAIGTLLEMLGNTGPDAARLSRLAEAYARWADRGAGETGQPAVQTTWDGYRHPADAAEAAKLARRAAEAAVALEAESASAQRALGLSLAAGDAKGERKRPALSALGTAVAVDDKDATNYYAMGYGIRFYAQQEKDAGRRKAELERAVNSQKTALEMRPGYYDAHRELAYCYHLLDDTKNALREYEMANANRGQASDKSEVAGNSVALSALHQQEARNSRGEKRRQHEQASAGHMQEARDNDPDLKQALRVLSYLGLGGRLTNFLPREVQQVFNTVQNPVGRVESEIRNKVPVRIPGGFGF